MIERQFVAEKIKEFNIQEYIAKKLNRAGHVKIEIKKTPLGEKIIIHTTRPGMVVGMKGGNIKELTAVLKEKYGMENPQIEVADIPNPNLDAASIANRIKFNFERYGPRRFKFLGYDTLKNILNAGALGAEIVISGRGVPSKRSKTWRFPGGYLKKSGDVSESKMDKAEAYANLKSGTIGIKVVIMPPDLRLPDKVIFVNPEDVGEKKLLETKESEKVSGSKKGGVSSKKKEKKEEKKTKGEKMIKRAARKKTVKKKSKEKKEERKTEKKEQPKEEKLLKTQETEKVSGLKKEEPSPKNEEEKDGNSEKK